MPTITITADYDCYMVYQEQAQAVYWKEATQATIRVGYEYPKDGYPTHYRGAWRFPLNNLPADATVTQVRRKYYCNGAGGASHLVDDHAYGSNGQEDPGADIGYPGYPNCASGNLYSDDSDEFRTTGEKWRTLGGSVCADVQAAKAAVNRFSLALHEEGDDDPYATIEALEAAGSNPPQLEITYTVPVVWGGSALPQLQMAKAVLGLYLPWSKRFPKFTPRIF